MHAEPLASGEAHRGVAVERLPGREFRTYVKVNLHREEDREIADGQFLNKKPDLRVEGQPVGHGFRYLRRKAPVEAQLPVQSCSTHAGIPELMADDVQGSARGEVVKLTVHLPLQLSWADLTFGDYVDDK